LRTPALPQPRTGRLAGALAHPGQIGRGTAARYPDGAGMQHPRGRSGAPGGDQRPGHPLHVSVCCAARPGSEVGSFIAHRFVPWAIFFLLVLVGVAGDLCRPLRWYAPATTRREPIHGGSLMPYLASNGRGRGIPTQRQKLRAAEGFTPQRRGVRWPFWGAGLCRPSVFRDENREPTCMYSRRVGTALHPSTALHTLTATCPPTAAHNVSLNGR